MLWWKLLFLWRFFQFVWIENKHQVIKSILSVQIALLAIMQVCMIEINNLFLLLIFMVYISSIILSSAWLSGHFARKAIWKE